MGDGEGRACRDRERPDATSASLLAYRRRPRSASLQALRRKDEGVSVLHCVETIRHAAVDIST